MKTTKTSEAIAKRMRKRGYNRQIVDWQADGSFFIRLFRQGVSGMYYETTTKTITATYRDIERQWEKEQADASSHD